LQWTFYAVAIPAVVILGVGKGGFAGIGMVALPLMALAVPPLQAASIMLPILMIQDAVGVWAYRRTWHGRNLAILVPAGGIGVLAGYLLAARVSVAAVELAVGIISILFGARQILVQLGSAPAPARQHGTFLGLVCGAGAGFTSMLAHAGAPPFQIYTIPQRLSRDVFVGTSVIFFAATNWMKLGPYVALGELTLANMRIAATLVPLAIVSTWLGVYLVRRTSGPLFFLLIYVLMVAIGIRLCLRGLGIM
jgi:uncharacterized protein